MKPQRIQLKRTEGFNLQAVSMAMNGLPAVKCARPGKWGNPIKAGMSCWEAGEAIAEKFGARVDVQDSPHSAAIAVKLYRWCLENVADSGFDTDDLRGKNLACFCPLDKPCHCDVLLELANR
ncbi:MAG: DUF4326 domain-containing protein [Tepidisphaeraceae bacterium]